MKKILLLLCVPLIGMGDSYADDYKFDRTKPAVNIDDNVIVYPAGIAMIIIILLIIIYVILKKLKQNKDWRDRIESKIDDLGKK
jgi:hypothetical protein